MITNELERKCLWIMNTKLDYLGKNSTVWDEENEMYDKKVQMIVQKGSRQNGI